jgi:hypothetical protein
MGQSVRAATITWGAPTAVTTADATLTQEGTVLEAAYTGTTADGTDSPITVTLGSGATITYHSASINGKLSDAAVSVTGNSGAEIGALYNQTTGTTFSTGNASFDNVLTTFLGVTNQNAITVKNLVSGRQYSVQLFALDDRNDTTRAWAIAYADKADYSGNNSSSLSMGENRYITGTFTATSTSETFYEQCQTYFDPAGGNYAGFGSVIVRDVTPAPEPGTITLVGTGILGVLVYAWRKRK